ncbi:MAG: DUF3445 domain-containing protein [Sandaracinus sp.]|nr:DUF3445 domain-containing protein [Sandaracinus sp.]MCB9632537.1 DUF3445 domain-containing protein [Sandaracinus sp.]
MPTPHYFPVEDEPLQMVASLLRFGTDFGNGAFDSQYFQVDDRYDDYVTQKRLAPSHRRFVVGDDPAAKAARDEALAWMRTTLAREHPRLAAAVEADIDAKDPFDAIARHVQEDFAILNAGEEDRGRTLAVDVRFPSGWRPERLREAGFDAIHAPVPGFPPNEKASRGMVRAMVDRGPYARFVWTVGASDTLDQHPERFVGDRLALWNDARDAYYRVERQVTVPLPKTRSSVFLIRVYVKPLSELTADERSRLARAIRQMPAEVRAYKSLPEPEVFERVLAAMG